MHLRVVEKKIPRIHEIRGGYTDQCQSKARFLIGVVASENAKVWPKVFLEEENYIFLNIFVFLYVFK